MNGEITEVKWQDKWVKLGRGALRESCVWASNGKKMEGEDRIKDCILHLFQFHWLSFLMLLCWIDYHNTTLYIHWNIPRGWDVSLFLYNTHGGNRTFICSLNWAIATVTSIHMLIGHYNTQVAQLSASHKQTHTLTHKYTFALPGTQISFTNSLSVLQPLLCLTPSEFFPNPFTI